MSDSAALTILDGGHKPITIVVAQRKAIVECMQFAMKKDIDYGTIPGTNKPSLYKPGSEKLLSMFHLAAKPVVEDLSTPDTIRYRVSVIITESITGRYLGEGVGEASSAESKYQWRGSVCIEEFNDTPEDRRRRKWKKSTSGSYTVDQVRADMEDVANTILKMAKKRAQIDAVLTVTAASDVFSQDLEDLPPEMALEADRDDEDGASRTQALPEKLQQKAADPIQRPQQPQQAQPQQGALLINEAQGRRFYAIRKSTDCRRTDEEVKAKLMEKTGSADDRKMPVAMYDAAIGWLKGGSW